MHYLWHHAVHEERGKSRLCFLRLQFLPTYSPTVLDVLPDLLRQARLGAFSIYETFGSYDVLIRAWVPTSVKLDTLAAELDAGLREYDLYGSDYFEVADVLRHWCWPEGGALGQAGRHRLTRTTDQQLVAIDQAKADLDGSDSPANQEDLTKALDARLIVPLPSNDGIRFFVVVTEPMGSVPSKFRRHLSDAVSDICRRTEETGLTDWSLHSGHGFGTLLLMGRVAAADFGVVRALVNEIGGDHFVQAYKMRTFTAVSAVNTFVHFEDRLALTIRESRRGTLRDDILKPEAEDFEVKASAFADIGAMLRSTDTKVTRLDALIETISKTVCAFLNAPSGGTVLLGVLELDDFLRRFRDEDGLEERIRDQVGERYQQSDRIIVGLDADIEAAGAAGWDEYTRRLQAAVQKRITPNCAPWISFRREVVDGRTIGAIDVSPMSMGWAYGIERTSNAVVHRFWVREYGQTKEYTGPDADQYKLTGTRGDEAPDA